MLKAGLATQTEGPGGTGPHGTKVVLPPPSLAEIATLFPQLEILECLGRGGMGVVYKARQPRLNRFVALKILAREKEQDAQFAERFTREAQALARLNHPNIVTVHDFGSVGQASCLPGERVSASVANESDSPTSSAGAGTMPALHYLVMEFVDGLNLRELLQARKMPSAQALTIVPKICEALQYAHEQGVVHRDIKPENILLDKSGRVKIADFGIAKMLGDEPGQQTLTGARDAVGTPHYMAPEQIEKPLSVDHRADIYSLGVVFYEMLTGELPLGKFAPPSQKVHIDVRLDEVVLHALEKEPERRYQQVSEIKTQVETIAATSELGRSRREEAQTEQAESQSRVMSSTSAPKTDWWLWSPFHSPEVREICAHLTKEERNQVSLVSLIIGVAYTAVMMWGIQTLMVTSISDPGMWIVFSILVILFIVCFPIGARLLRRLLCATAWARQQGYKPEQFRIFSFRGNNLWKGLIVLLVGLLLVFGVTKLFMHLSGTAELAQSLEEDAVRTKELSAQLAAHTKSFSIGQAWFPQGDSIEITSVERSADRMDVKGCYNLVSHDNALLALYLTTESSSSGRESAQTVSQSRLTSAATDRNEMQISKGRGNFELIHPHVVPGLPHVSMYADGKPFASLYFGTKVEALEESKAGWIRNAASASTLQFRLVLPTDSTEPADWLPSASGSNRFHLSRQVLLDDHAIARAGVDFTQGRQMIAVRFTDAGAKKFEAITATNIGHQLAIVFRSQVLSAPVIQSAIPGGQCQVDGAMTADEVNEIVDCLNRTTTPTAMAWDFSPSHERILPFKPLPDALPGWLDLDSGRVLTNFSLDLGSRSGYEWIRTNGLDVVTTESAQHFPGLLGIDMIIAPAPTNGWDNVTAADVINNWTLLREEPQQSRCLAPCRDNPIHSSFKPGKAGKEFWKSLLLPTTHTA